MTTKTPWTLEQATTELEKRMVTAGGNKTHVRYYLAGVVDTWAEQGVITEPVRESLYTQYCF